MATQTVVAESVPGQTVTMKLFAGAGTSDTVVATSNTCTEQTNSKGQYVAAFVGTLIAAGTYHFRCFNASNVLLSDGYVDLAGTNNEVANGYDLPISLIGGGGGGDALEETSQEILEIVQDIQSTVTSATITTTGYAQFNSSGVLLLKEGHTATLTFTSTTNNVVSDLTSARVYLSVREVSGTPMVQVQGTVLVATGLQSVRFTLDAASAKKLRKGKCLFDVVAVYGYDATLTPPYTGLQPFTGGNAEVTRLELQL